MMSSYRFSNRSKSILALVQPELVIVATAALHLSPVDFVVIDGARTLNMQQRHVDSGASTRMDSMHVPIAFLSKGTKLSQPTACKWLAQAIDVAALVNTPDGRVTVSWDWTLYEQIAGAFVTASHLHGIPITWGGSWGSRDGPHFELKREVYRPWGTV